MAKATLYVPEALAQQMQALPAEVNLSALFQETLRAVVAGGGECSHPALRCRHCGRLVEAHELARPA